MCYQYCLLRLDDCYSFLPFLAVQTSVVGFQRHELLPGYVKAFRLYLFNVACIGKRGDYRFNLGGCDLQSLCSVIFSTFSGLSFRPSMLNTLSVAKWGDAGEPVLTAKPEDEAQTLVPSVLKMAALSILPVATRLGVK